MLCTTIGWIRWRATDSSGDYRGEATEPEKLEKREARELEKLESQRNQRREKPEKPARDSGLYSVEAAG